MFLEEKIMFRLDEMTGYKRLFDLKEVKELVKKENEENVAKRCDKEEKDESTLPPAFELDSY